ncbi:MAG TPA: DNA polymerase Y family protein, partial [Chitinophagaceae bacterium]|nr:DNA polymerase Y family protein [Chitinophagaceae bacterium]
MPKRFVSIWFRYLKTDWHIRHRPALLNMPFVLVSPDHGRMMITAANKLAQREGVDGGMVLADARAFIPSLEVMDDKPGIADKLLKGLAEYCIRYTPVVAIDPPEGLLFDVTGCAHLWGGEQLYLTAIISRLNELGYEVGAAMADTIGAAWALARYRKDNPVIETGTHPTALLNLPSAALRIEWETKECLDKLGLRLIRDFVAMPRTAMRRRFGSHFIHRLDQAFGVEEEIILPLVPLEPYQERLNCLEPILTATGIEIALQRLLEILCLRLTKEEKGFRKAIFKAYRIDGKIEKIEIGTHCPSHNKHHLFKLFELKIPDIEPAMGVELFVLEAPVVENISALQQKLWETARGLSEPGLAELLDRLAGKLGHHTIHRYLADEHYWPERSIKLASSIHENATTAWNLSRPRPLQLLQKPEPVTVTAPIPDYPPMLFRYKGKLHKITRADGPERIEQEWWIEEGEHRDYYS